MDKTVNTIHYVFGSQSSQDFDLLFLVKDIPNNEESHKLCSILEKKINHVYTSKKININIGVLKDGKITDVFKGTPDEVNNAIFDTYKLHNQLYPLLITVKVARDIHLKLLRSARIVLSFLSRTEYRNLIKKALRGDLNDKLDALEQIDFKKITDLGKNTSLIDFRKTCAFQFGQCFGLVEGLEFYTKEDIAKHHISLRPSLVRLNHESEMTILNLAKSKFTQILRREIPNMSCLVEKLRK